MADNAMISRRSLLKGSAAAAGAFTLGFSVPFTAAEAQATNPEINAWVVISPG